MNWKVTSNTISFACSLIYLSPTFVMSQDGQFQIKHVQDPIKDWSSICITNTNLSVYLTSSMGQSDSEVLHISGDGGIYPNCTITYYTSPGAVTIFVFEYPDLKNDELPINCNLMQVMFFENNNRTQSLDLCNEVNRGGKTFHVLLTSERIFSIEMHIQTDVHAMTFVTTATRKLRNGEQCDPDTEISCIRHEGAKILQLCMTVEVQCDGYINCGAVSEFDESEKACNDTSLKMLWVVLILCLVVFAIISFFLLRMLHRTVWRVEGNYFVFNEDEDNRLNLTTFYVQPPESDSDTKLSSSSYRFRTSSLHFNTPDRELTQSSMQEQNLGTEEDNRLNLTPFYVQPPESDSDTKLSSSSYRFRTSSLHFNTPDRELTKSSMQEQNLGTDGTKHPENDNKKTHFLIAPVSVEAVADYNNAQPQENLNTDNIPPKLKEKGLKGVHSSRTLISRKVPRRDVAGTEDA